MQLYRYVPVWSRASNGLVLYRCFEALGIGFTVQSKDHFPAESEPSLHLQLHSQFIELFTEQPPELRFPCEPTIEAAIAAFDNYFRGE